jgi:hypothetical protein
MAGSLTIVNPIVNPIVSFRGGHEDAHRFHSASRGVAERLSDKLSQDLTLPAGWLSLFG